MHDERFTFDERRGVLSRHVVPRRGKPYVHGVCIDDVKSIAYSLGEELDSFTLEGVARSCFGVTEGVARSCFGVTEDGATQFLARVAVVAASAAAWEKMREKLIEFLSESVSTN